MEHLVSSTFYKFVDLELCQRRGQDRHILAEFPLPEVYCLTLSKIYTQELRLLDRNKAKKMEKVLIVKDVLEETQLLLELM